ncbi:MAG: tetratricopeptide repeat protein [Thalassobaculum sp.]
MDAQAQRNEAARKLGAGLADILSAVTVGVPLGTLADKSVDYLQKQVAANKAAIEGDAAARRAARDLAQAAFRQPIATGRLRRGSEATLLRAERGIVPFSGREAELAEFAAWFDDDEPMRWRLLTGPSGRGKTRFMQHVVETYGAARGDRMLAGFIDLDAIARTPEVLAGFLAHKGEVLLVVDYAERARAQTTAILKLALMLETAADAGADLKVRVVLIARGLSEVWQQIGVEHEDIGAVMNSTEGQFDIEDLPPLVDTPEARREEFARAFAAFDKALNPDASADGRPPAADRVPALASVPPRDDFREAVTIHLAALAAVQGAMRADEMTDTRLLDWIVDRERREWAARARDIFALPDGVLGKAMDEAVGVVTLAAAASQEPDSARVTELLAACPRLAECPRGRREALAGLLDDLYPGENGPVGLTPDLLGTYFLGLLDPHLFTSVFAVLDEQEATNGLTKLNWLAQGWREPGERANPVGTERILAAIAGNMALTLPVVIDVAQQSGDPIGVIAAGVVERIDDPQLALHLEGSRGFPKQTVALRELAVAVETVLFEQETDNDTEDGRNRRASRANDLSNRLSDLGRREAALTVIEEAVALRRTLSEARPDAFTPVLATSLNNLSNGLSALGRREAALAAIEEAVALYRTLSAARPDAFTPDLAMSLNNLSAHLAGLGRREAALTAIEEAVALYRTLSEARPDAFLPDLAMSLNNLSGRLADLGRREEALSAIEEAVALRRTLAAARPDAFTPVLAGSLNNLSAHLADLGRPEEALTAIEEAVALYRPLAEARPDAFLPDLAMSLNNLSGRLADLGRPEEALSAIEEAVALRRTLAAARPDAFTPVLAGSLNNLSAHLADLGRPEEALTAIEEAVALYRPLAEARPDAFTPDLAGALNNLSVRLSALGRPEEALTAIEEAVALRRSLAAARPEAFTHDFATSLARRGEVLLAADRFAEAASSVGEFLLLIAPLVRQFPRALAPQCMGNIQLYGKACQAAGIEPGMDLVGPILQTLVEHGLIDLPDDAADADTPPNSTP